MTSPPTATPDLAVANRDSDNVSVLLGGAGGHVQRADQLPPPAPRPYRWRSATSTRDGDPDLAVANFASDNVSVLLGGAGGALRGADQLRRRRHAPSRWRSVTSTATVTRPGRRQLRLGQRLGAARRPPAARFQRRRPTSPPAQPPLGGGRRPQRRRRRPTWPSPTSSDNVSVLLGGRRRHVRRGRPTSPPATSPLGGGRRLQRRRRARPGRRQQVVGRRVGAVERLEPGADRGRRQLNDHGGHGVGRAGTRLSSNDTDLMATH